MTTLMDTEATTVPFWKKRWVKFVFFCACFVVAFLTAFVYLGTNMDDIIAWKSDRDARAFDAKLEGDRETLVAMEKADTYGSTTPEGTIALIITALEAGDIDLASKYYYVLDQEKAKASFEKQLAEKGNFAFRMQYFKDVLGGKKHCNLDFCTLNLTFITEIEEGVIDNTTGEHIIIPAGEQRTKSVTLRVNSFTGLWKTTEY